MSGRPLPSHDAQTHAHRGSYRPIWGQCQALLGPRRASQRRWQREHAVRIGILFWLFGRRIDGPGLSGSLIIYQGHPFPLKGHLWLFVFGLAGLEGQVAKRAGWMIIYPPADRKRAQWRFQQSPDSYRFRSTIRIQTLLVHGAECLGRLEFVCNRRQCTGQCVNRLSMFSCQANASPIFWGDLADDPNWLLLQTEEEGLERFLFF